MQNSVITLLKLFGVADAHVGEVDTARITKLRECSRRRKSR